jgi:hypothetical protein
VNTGSFSNLNDSKANHESDVWRPILKKAAKIQAIILMLRPAVMASTSNAESILAKYFEIRSPQMLVEIAADLRALIGRSLNGLGGVFQRMR